MSALKPSFLLAFALLISACNSDDGSTEITFNDVDIQGKINGIDWVYLDGRAFEYSDWDSLLLELYPIVHEQVCPFARLSYSENKIARMTIPMQEGRFDFEQSNLRLILTGSKNLAVGWGLHILDGAIEIQSISDDVVSGRISATFDDESYVNGNFSVQRCNHITDYQFLDRPAQGMVYGEEWLFVDGFAFESSINGSSHTVELRIEENKDQCQNGFEQDINSMQVYIPDTPGVITLGSSNLGGFIYSDLLGYDYLLGGGVEVTSISESQISGNVDVRTSRGNYINGSFTVDRCQD